MLSDRCLVCLSALSVCDGGVLWPNGWMHQDETWHAGRPRRWPHSIRWGPSSLPKRGQSPPIFSPCLLWPNGWMDQDATWYEGWSWLRPHCVTWGSSSPKRDTAPQFSAHVYCGQTVAHLSYCWALVNTLKQCLSSVIGPKVTDSETADIRTPACTTKQRRFVIGLYWPFSITLYTISTLLLQLQPTFINRLSLIERSIKTTWTPTIIATADNEAWLYAYKE